MTDYTFIAHTRGPLDYTDCAKYFLEQHATSFGNYFSDILKKKYKKIAYTDLLQKGTEYLRL